MKISKQQNQELDSLKSSIEYIEKNIEIAKIDRELAMDLDNLDEIKKNDKAIDYGLESIRKKIQIQSEAMKLEFNLVVDLIFDRNYTLENVS